MKKLLLGLVLLLFIGRSWAALSATDQWNVRNGGSDTNGGAFKAGATGTDLSLQAGPEWNVTAAVTNNSTTITSATAAFNATVVGNVAYVSGGTSSITAGWYEVANYTNATIIKVDSIGMQ